MTQPTPPPRPWEQPTPPQWPAAAEPAPYQWPAGTGPQAGHELITVPLAPCCGEVLAGEDCSCADLYAESWVAWDRPIILPPVGPGPLVDPALRDREVA